MQVLILLLLLLLVPFASADELTDAYQKEYAYLVAEKQAVQQRLSVLKRRQSTTLNQLRSEIDVLERSFLGNQNQVDRLNQEILEAGRTADSVESDVQLLDTTLLQARESLAAFDAELSDNDKGSELLSQAFDNANSAIIADGQVTRSAGSYFKTDGSTVEAEQLHVGRIARFGLGDDNAGLLYPSGNGLFSLWDSQVNGDTKQLAAGETPETIDIFLYDNINKAIEKRDDKGFMEDVDAGGLIGKIILGLGVLGVVFVVLRVIYLSLYSSNISHVAEKVDHALKSDDREKALQHFEKGQGSAHRVIAKTVKNLDKDRDHIEDIVSESILHERSRIDRFRAIILVIAAVSPLLGLLGTVTGMITTFDIITEFGTGDPKLLSSGISEALVTTKFGLMVAIPLLLLGNVLSSWGNRIKSDLEQSALYVINTHKA